MAVRKLTAGNKVQLNRLVGIIESFLPISSWSTNATTFQSIFKESNVHKYLKAKGTKKQRLVKAFSKLYQQHKKLPFTILRKVIAEGEQYRRHKRNPIQQQEIDELSDCLDQLNLNLKNELSAVSLDFELPKITIPPKELVCRLENHPLVDDILSDPLQKFKDGHFNEAVRKACEKYETKIQNITGNSGIGSSLMGQVFNPQNPVITITAGSPQNSSAIQEGYQKLAMGMMSGIRNIFSHGDENRRTPEEAYEMLLFINWMFRKLEEQI